MIRNLYAYHKDLKMIKSKNIFYVICFVILGLALSNCSPATAKVKTGADNDVMYQVSTLNALMLGQYDGAVTAKEFLANGDTGIGTIDHLDGEMIVVDGKMYQIKSDGKVYTVSDSTTTPFGVVTDFEKDVTVKDLKGIKNIDELKKTVNKSIDLGKNKNYIYVIKLEGEFNKIHVRSVPRQNKPYPPLKEVAKQQTEFKYNDSKGVIVGVYFPNYFSQLNVSGWHFHYISNDRKVGGHLLNVDLKSGVLDIDVTDEFKLIMPKNDSFGNIDMTDVLESDVKNVESK